MEESQKLFRLPGTIGEEEEREMKEHNPLQTPEGTVRLESPLLYRKGTTTISSLPKNITLVRVSTQSSSIGGVYRQDSTRWDFAVYTFISLFVYSSIIRMHDSAIGFSTIIFEIIFNQSVQKFAKCSTKEYIENKNNDKLMLYTLAWILQRQIKNF